MGYTAAWLSKILGEIQIDTDVLREARHRRDFVLSAAKNLDGALRSFNSGSVAHGTAIKPISDSDGGGVLDRRTYPQFGPDGDGDGPNEVVAWALEQMVADVRREYPNARGEITKRALKFTFSKPLPSGEDPTVDAVIALTRRDAEGLWIPNTENNSWSASHPEKHTELLVAPPKALRVLRARTVRLAKAWNKQYLDPAVSSFNIEALALEAVKAGRDLERALADLFAYGASDLAKRLTPDPAQVSSPIKCPNRNLAVRRLQTAARAMQDALTNDDDEDKVKQALSRVFFDYVEASPSESKDGLASTIRSGTVGIIGATVSTNASAAPIKSVRSFGDHR